jgi:hypothetical protein
MSVGFRIWSLLRHQAGAARPSSMTASSMSSPSMRPASMRLPSMQWRLLRFVICYLLPAWCCIVGAAPAASAATSAEAPDEPAPMCDPDGASVAAPEDIPEVDRGRFEALPCEAQLLLSGWRLDMPEVGRKAASCRDAEPASPVHHTTAPPQRFEGARALTILFPTRPEPQSASFGVADEIAPSRGHERGLFRPPVVR